MPGTLAEKIYYKLPTFLQNTLFSTYGWSLSRKRYNHFFYEHLEKLKEMQWWSADDIRKYQDENIARIVRHAYETVPFYRKWYDENDVDISSIQLASDLKFLPILTKKMVRQNNHEMTSSLIKKNSFIKCFTSGTTGTPLTIYHTPESLAYQRAIWWRHKARFGLNVKDRHLTFGARVPIAQDQTHPPYWRNDYLNNRVYLSIYHISKRTVADIVTYLNKKHFAFYTGYPSAMYVLASLIKESGLHIHNHPDYIVTGADALLPKYEKLISQIFGAPVTEQYGMAEFAGNMSKCELGNFHEDFECCYIERMSNNNSDCHSLIMSGWGNYGMPFIRYEVGDYGKPMNTPCACGRNSRAYSGIDGRLEDYVITPDGRKLIGMNQVFEYATNASEIQIYQKVPGQVEFRIVPNVGFGDGDKQALIREFQRRGGNSIDITFRMVDELERSASGKLKAVVSEVST